LEKKVPQRRCTACMETKDKRELMRIVKSPDGEILFDEKGKMSGRGAYICKSTACLEKAEKKKSLSRALGTEIPHEVYEKLKEKINADG